MSAKKRRQVAPRVVDVAKILHSRITVVQGDEQVKMQPWEASTRALLVAALGGNMRAARRFLQRCHEAGLFAIPEVTDDHRYVLVIPKDWDRDEWMAKYHAIGPPPWYAERNGLVENRHDG